jgi:hypothetical protein
MWTLKQLQDPEMPMANINGKWVHARPLNYKRAYMSLRDRIRHAWAVFTCRAEAFTWPEGQ